MTISQTNPGQLRPSGDGGGAIIRVGEGRRREAIERLVASGRDADNGAVDRFLHYARVNAVSLEGLWARLDPSGAIGSAVLAVPSPGRTAMVFASRPAGDQAVGPIAGLIDHACSKVRGWDVHLAQALLEPDERHERAAFLGGGFRELAELSYMERPLSRPAPERPVWSEGVAVEPYDDACSGDLAAALERSYEDTLDCPGLYGLRRTADIVAGHRATGVFDPKLWTLLRLNGEPAGALLLNPFPGQKTIELVYIGLARSARGRGIGRELLRHGLCLVKDRRERTLTLAVDRRNTPALALYAAEGFRAVVRRVALIRPLRGG